MSEFHKEDPGFLENSDQRSLIKTHAPFTTSKNSERSLPTVVLGEITVKSDIISWSKPDYTDKFNANAIWLWQKYD